MINSKICYRYLLKRKRIHPNRVHKQTVLHIIHFSYLINIQSNTYYQDIQS